MRFGITKDYDWELIGAQLAQLGDIEQVAFFKAFVAECKTWGTHLQVERQFSCINSKLTQDERETLSMITYEGEE